jgi:hypothetical protein
VQHNFSQRSTNLLCSTSKDKFVGAFDQNERSCCQPLPMLDQRFPSDLINLSSREWESKNFTDNDWIGKWMKLEEQAVLRVRNFTTGQRLL